MDAKEEPPGMGLRRAPAKLYGAFSRRMLRSRLCSLKNVAKLVKISKATIQNTEFPTAYLVNNCFASPALAANLSPCCRNNDSGADSRLKV